VIVCVLAERYDGNMLPLPLPQPHDITVVVGLPHTDQLLDVIAQLALLGPVQVIVGGNRFDVHKLARLIRRHTLFVDQTLTHIQQARPFTCYQMISLLKDTKSKWPLVVMDMLTTFYDENLSDEESIRLVSLAIAHIQRLAQFAPVLVTIRPPPPTVGTRAILVEMLWNCAGQVFSYDPPMKPIQPTLF
jgi:hypothetical protein